MSFEVVKSLYSVRRSAIHHPKLLATLTDAYSQLKDLAFELRLEDFAFRWETNCAGPRISAEVISRQIIKPLMSTAYLAFSTPSSVGEMSESDLEIVSGVKPLTRVLMIRYGLHVQAVDKLGRTARRTPGMHVRNSISKPRIATTIRRMTAMLNFLVEVREYGPLS